MRGAESTAAHATDLEPVVETRDAILAVTIRPGDTLVDEPGSVAQIGDDRARMVGRLRTVDLHVFGCDPDTASVPPDVPAASGASPSHHRSARSPQSGPLPPPWLAPRPASTRHRRPSPRRSRSRLRAEDVEYSEFERHRVRLARPRRDVHTARSWAARRARHTVEWIPLDHEPVHRAVGGTSRAITQAPPTWPTGFVRDPRLTRRRLRVR